MKYDFNTITIAQVNALSQEEQTAYYRALVDSWKRTASRSIDADHQADYSDAIRDREWTKC
jgi:hypothetical protein